jgi:hypothetical protein
MLVDDYSPAAGELGLQPSPIQTHAKRATLGQFCNDIGIDNHKMLLGGSVAPLVSPLLSRR